MQVKKSVKNEIKSDGNIWTKYFKDVPAQWQDDVTPPAPLQMPALPQKSWLCHSTNISTVKGKYLIIGTELRQRRDYRTHHYSTWREKN
jgi:hypothetical protein